MYEQFREVMLELTLMIMLFLEVIKISIVWYDIKLDLNAARFKTIIVT